MINSYLVDKINDYGEVVLEEIEVVDALLKGNNVSDVYIPDESAVHKYENSIQRVDVEDFPVFKHAKTHDMKPEDFLYRKSLSWKVPAEYMYFDIENYLLGKCKNETEIMRVKDEIREFERRDEIDILRVMKYVVDSFRKNNVVWGVGRGSSVSSFCLYLIGINKIDPLKYDIPYTEYFKDKEIDNG